MPQSNYAKRQAAKKERYQELAQKHAIEAEARSNAAHKLADMIPFGQPILVGHHSEKRHRADIKRIQSNTQKALDHQATAEYYENKAKGMGKAISSDDPEAVQKLLAKLEKAQSDQETYKAINKAVKMADTAAGDAIMAGLGLSAETIAKVRTPDFAGRIGIPSYVLANNNSNMAAMKKRIEALRAATTATTSETETNGVKIVENAEENRIQLIFPGIPSEATRQMLKSRGFRWSPTNKAWQRHLNNAGRYAAQEVVTAIGSPDIGEA